MKIKNTETDTKAPISIVVAGEAGNGKTTLAATLQEGLGEKVLIISAEAGLLSLRGRGVDYLELQMDEEGKDVPKQARIARLGQIYQWLMQPEQMARYQWIFIDSLTEIQQNLHEFLESQEEYQGPKNTIKKFGELSNRMLSLCKSFRDMPHYNKVFSALVKNETDQDNQTKMKVSLIGSFSDRLPALFDEIFYLGVTNEVAPDGRNIRQLLTQKTDRIDFPKDRSGRLSRLMPADLSAVVKKIRSQPVVADISSAAKAAHAEVLVEKSLIEKSIKELQIDHRQLERDALADAQARP
jgi:hypothetical protein